MNIKENIKSYFRVYSAIPVVSYKPLEYLEVKQDKPFIKPLTNGWIFICKLQTIGDFISFNESKNMILSEIERLNNVEKIDLLTRTAKIINYKLLIELLYQLSKKQYGFFKRIRYRKYLHKYLFNNFNIFLDIFKELLRFNTGLKKKQESIQKHAIFPKNVSLTFGGQHLEDLIRINPETGEKYFIH